MAVLLGVVGVWGSTIYYTHLEFLQIRQKNQQPRMHSSRMRAVRCSDRLQQGEGGVCTGSVCPGGLTDTPSWTE